MNSIVSGKSIVFNGNGYLFDGGGWPRTEWRDTKAISDDEDQDVWHNVTVFNSPARVYSVSNPAPLLMTNLTVDNAQGDVPNNQSNGLPAGHNTDGFDCSTTNLVIENSYVHNQASTTRLALVS
ncbi:hypothetical protein NLJ89_g11168 [Agrocybe chaxingu]|uniref:Uncharacterized protein n=1 Tax=Agrocybe chaxingu TaxID=84603 RepID=A0A9W8JXA1_9AGAR|nr:hypothetical protein NLJ89_g11168 [Agrocybe chaxingu]